MWWRIRRSEFERSKGAVNRRRLAKLVEKGTIPGILAYRQRRPVAWCAVEPREAYPVLGRSRVLRPVDDRPVWSVPCLFVVREQRRSGLSVELLAAAAEHARRGGASVLEGYPVEPRAGKMPDAFAFTGLVAAFRAAGFVEVARRSPTRPVMRLELR
jgi:GNAT superfamily N-acetyltransferase